MKMQIRVYYEDTDCGNVVYYANYLRYLERSRTELLREHGIDLAELHNRGFLFVVTEACVQYKSSAVYNDLLEVETTIGSITAASMVFTTAIRRSGEEGVLVRGEVTAACVTAGGRPVRIPGDIREKLKAAEESPSA